VLDPAARAGEAHSRNCRAARLDRPRALGDGGQYRIGIRLSALWLLARLRGWRPRSFRFQEEQRAIETWLGLIVQAARLSVDLALEVAECARLIKGYGDTHKRGTANYRLIETRIIAPVLAGGIPLRQGIDAVASARAAALLDPESEALTRCLAELDQHNALSIAAE
jgi:indolepyruvate ferredoxin oxidoreductase beta subunit